MSDRDHPAIVHWSEIEKPEPFSYDGSDEPMAGLPDRLRNARR